MRALAWAVIVFAGCAGPVSDANAPPAPVHPHPAGDGTEWPVLDGLPLKGPFEMLAPQSTSVAAADGTDLHVWLLRPDLPRDVKAPVVLWAAPYFGTTMAAGDDPELWDNSDATEAVPVQFLVENGYAVAIMNLRGSGQSGGCFTLFGSTDWDDTATVVEWLGAQEWSNGRVGMMGLSYHGTTPWQAAVRAPEALKTIVTAGMIHNLYTFFHTDQGAAQAAGPSFSTLVAALVATVPPNEPAGRLVQDWMPRLPERWCQETLPVLTEVYASDYTDSRDTSFWEDRRIIRDMPSITASVLLTHGLRDLTGHATQEDPVWQALGQETPKRMILGQWGHVFPNFSSAWSDTREAWDQVHLAWFDYWLKGLGSPEGLGSVEFQDDALAWHNATSWPPQAHQEVLHLCRGMVGGACEAPQGSFLSVPGAADGAQQVCNGAPGEHLVFLSQPLDQDVVLAGNPFAWLELESDLPGGLITLRAYEVDPTCNTRSMAFGAADLRHHAGNYDGRDFPLDQPTGIRIDMTNLAESLAAGNQIALVASYGDPAKFEAVPYAPRLTIHGGSHVVWPVLDGTLGGQAPAIEYPPRPFVEVAS